MRANFDEICRNCEIYFEESEFSSTFRCTYCSHIIEISCKRAKFPMALRLGKRNFASEISWNISFVRVEIELNVDEVNKSCA